MSDLLLLAIPMLLVMAWSSYLDWRNAPVYRRGCVHRWLDDRCANRYRRSLGLPQLSEIPPSPPASPTPEPDPTLVGEKKCPSGKVWCFMNGDPAWVPQAGEALAASMDMTVLLNRERFVHLMREKQVPEDAIGEFVASFGMVDESWLGGPERSYSW